nr:LysR family transcriptional regulator [Shimwellia pseudoproteus]
MYVQEVDAGSFSAAGRILNTDQPTVSKTIAQMEAHLGVRLLLRTTHGLSATEAGLRFYDRVRTTLQQAEEAQMAAREAGSGLSGVLRVAAAPTFARLHVIPQLAPFMAQNPQLNIDIVLDDRTIDPVAEGIDICLRLGALQDSGAVARKLATTQRCVFASPAYLARHGHPRHPAELSQHQTLVVNHQTRQWTFTQAGSEVSVAIDSRLHFSAAEGTRAAVLAGMGLTIASNWMFTQALADGRIVRVLEAWQLPEVDLWAVFPGGRMASAKAREFAHFMGNCF